MSIKSKLLAAAATLTLVGGAAAGLAPGPASAATPSCGFSCVNVFSREFGTHASPNFVFDVYRQGMKAGTPIILFRTSNSDPAEDFTVGLQGQVSDFYQVGMVSGAVALHYGCGFNRNTGLCGNGFPDDLAFEIQYSPNGVESGMCVGVGSVAAQGTKVALEPCGVGAGTVWITDVADVTGLHSNYVPLVNGSDTNFSQPFVLTYPQNGYPTDLHRPQLVTKNLTGYSGSILPGPGTVNGFQEWGGDFGVLH
jgi:hypothetical protein